jgi:hypothetical protein
VQAPTFPLIAVESGLTIIGKHPYEEDDRGERLSHTVIGLRWAGRLASPWVVRLVSRGSPSDALWTTLMCDYRLTPRKECEVR